MWEKLQNSLVKKLGVLRFYRIGQIKWFFSNKYYEYIYKCGAVSRISTNQMLEYHQIWTNFISTVRKYLLDIHKSSSNLGCLYCTEMLTIFTLFNSWEVFAIWFMFANFFKLNTINIANFAFIMNKINKMCVFLKINHSNKYLCAFWITLISALWI